MRRHDVTDLLARVTAWTRDEPGIAGLALVGSHARGAALGDSDVDLLLLCDSPAALLEERSWVERFGRPRRQGVEEWGKVTSVRVWYAGGLEVEFGVTGADWAADAADPGTAGVIAGGIRILYDRDGGLAERTGRSCGPARGRGPAADLGARSGRAVQPSGCVISPFTIGDYEEAFALWERCEGVGLSDADEPARIAAYLERNPGVSFVARVDGALAGAALCGHDGRRGYIYHLAVDAGHRRRGIGGALAESCLEALRARGIRKCHLFVYVDNEVAVDFWKRRAWVPRADIAVMSITLQEPGAPTPGEGRPPEGGVRERPAGIGS